MVAGLVFGALSVSGPALAHSRLPGLLVLQERSTQVWDVRLELPPAVGAGVVLHPPAHCTVEETLSLQRWTCPEGLRGGTLAASGLAAHAIDLLVRTEPLTGPGSTGLLHAGAPEWTVPASPAGAGAMIGHGLRHILGADISNESTTTRPSWRINSDNMERIAARYILRLTFCE